MATKSLRVKFTSIRRARREEHCRELSARFSELPSARCAECVDHAASELARRIASREGVAADKDLWTLWCGLARAQAFGEVVRENHDEQCRALQRKFPFLPPETVEECVQQASFEIVRRIIEEDFQPNEGWRACWRWLAHKRALGHLRRHEEASLDAIGDAQGDFEAPSPSGPLREQERRHCQVELLSDILYDFCQDCEREDRPEGAFRKEVYERRMRGQEIQQIVADMETSRARVDTSLHRAKQWIRQSIERRDVHRTVFATVLGGRCEGQLGPENPAPSVSHAEAPDPALPVLRDMTAVLWFVLDHGGMCPSLERLAVYAALPQAEGFSDVRYHVDEAGCQSCRVELEYLRCARR
jgi:hypothetical protein